MPKHGMGSGSKKIQGVQPISPLSFGYNMPEMKEEILAAHTINKGMFTDIDAAIIPDSGLALAKNVVIRDDKTSRRAGSIIFTPAAPNGLKILRVIDYVRRNGVTNIIRHTKSTVHYATGGAWTACTGPALTGTDLDIIDSAIISDRYFFVNNGKDVIMEVNVNANTYAALGNAPKYKKITGFFNRVIGANLQGGSPDPSQIGWSGDLNFGEWNTVTDPSAGFVSLVNSTEDVADFITDIYGFDSVLVILRQKSIWMANPQPSATNPFYFYSKIPGLGCTCPYGAAQFPEGIIFPDLRTQSIYTFHIDGTVEDIGIPIRRALMSSITDPDLVFGSYNPIESEYTLCVPNTGTGLTKAWTFNFRTKAWSVNEFPNVSCVIDVNNIVGSKSIDDLTGTINSLSGTIDSLAGVTSALPRRLYGKSDGTLFVETPGQITDPSSVFTYGGDYGADSGLTRVASGIAFETELVSKVYVNPGYNMYISSCNFEVTCKTIGTFLLYYSKDGGKNFNYVTTFVVDINHLLKTVLLQYKKLFNSRRFQWKLYTINVQFDLLSNEIKAYPASGHEINNLNP
jgi:hypothetical protein